MRIFVSYSRVDKELVAPIAAILRIGGDIFRDEDNIRPGERWAQALSDALAACETVVVFWSRAASESRYVESECREALNSGKDIVPILLDDTPLSEALAQHQWLDFRPFLKAAARRELAAPFATGRIIGYIPAIGTLLPAVVMAAIYTKLLNSKSLVFEAEEAESMRRLLAVRVVGGSGA